MTSVVRELFPEIPSAAQQATTAEPLSMCAASDSLASGCLTEILPIEAAPQTSTSKLPSAMPSDCSAADLVPDYSYSCVGARSDPNASRAANGVSLKDELAPRTLTCRPARRKVNPHCNLRSRFKVARLSGLRRNPIRLRLRFLPQRCSNVYFSTLSLSGFNPRSVVARVVRLARDLRT